MDDLFDNTEFEEGERGTRDRLIILLLYSTGMRLTELINLKVSDIDLSSATLKVLGKGNKERILPFSNQFKNVLKKYLDEVSPVEWLFYWVDRPKLTCK